MARVIGGYSARIRHEPSERRVRERVRVKTGDITRESLDAIVNAANGSLKGKG